MSDQIDEAQEIEQRDNASALVRQQEAAASTEQPFEIQGRRVCLDCFEPIPKKRLKANPNAVRCTECQTDHERRERRGMARMG